VATVHGPSGAGESLRTVVLLLATLLAGCTVGPNYKSPHEGVPISFDGSLSTASTAAATQPSALATDARVDLRLWWKSLNDPELDSVVDRAVAANFDLRIAVARLQQAREIEYVTGGGALPGVGGTDGISMVGAAGRSSGNEAVRGRISGPVYSGINTTGLQEITHVVGFDSGWELDLFGRYTRLIEAAHADSQAAFELRNDVMIAVMADVIRSYIDVRSLQLRLEIARENAASQKRTAELVRVRFQRGLTNELDAVLAERQLSTTLARIAPLQAAIGAAQRRVAVLCGGFPEDLRVELDKPVPLPATPPSVGPGMPVELLRRRPDIRAAERRLAAATARIGIATANLYPRVSITAGAGFQGQGLGRTPVENSLVWSIGPTFYWPFLDFGQVDALVKLQDYQAEQAYWTFQKTVVTAVQEVDNSLSNYAAQQDSLTQLSSAVESSRKAVHIATQRYQDGLTDFLNVLDAERQLFDLEDQYAASQQSLIYEFISLYKALGGGWEGYEAPPPAIKPWPALIAMTANAIGARKSSVPPVVPVGHP
jgi:NodT family efflux transporter outer membrane factor (OMF) lipoprotein